ncbi:MAG: hypothetical protein RQ736_07850 [Thiogranum sp.]|nr:hypothetical protein [Thiogranum sp.]
MTRVFPALVVAVWLTACGAPGLDYSAYTVPAGSDIVLNREIGIPAGSAHVKFQHGDLSAGVDSYTVNCEFRVRDLGPQVVEPGSFTVTRSGDSREWAISPYTVRVWKSMTLESAQQADPAHLICQKWVDVDWATNLSINEMRDALGAWFSFP